MDLLLIALIAISALCGCSSSFPGGEEDASLSLKIGVGDHVALYRSSGSSEWEQAVDGQGVYCAAAFLFDGSSLVAHSQVQLQQLQSGAELKFSNDVPYGSYTLYIVANWGAYGDYEGMQGFAAAMEQVKLSGKMTEDFAGYLISSQGGVCKTVPHPLQCVMQVNLVPGANRVEALLERSVARIRIAVENNSNEILEVQSLSFSNRFTQQDAWLFGNRGYRNDRRCGITVGNQNAVVPFIGSYVQPVKLEAMGNTTVFDAYILESSMQQGESGYSYALKLAYETSEGYTEKTAQIALQTVDATTGQPEDVEEIRRNDFIDVVVRVTYSRNTGSIQFEVVPWYSGGGNVDFS